MKRYRWYPFWQRRLYIWCLPLVKVLNVDKYIHVAKDLREQSGKRNLFNQALRLIKARGKAEKIDCCKKTHQSPQFPSRSESGPAQISPCSKEKNCQDTPCFGIAWNKEEIKCVNYVLK